MKHSYLDAVAGFKVLAHRGFLPAGSNLIENTIAAFSAAIEVGVDYLELDVRATSDGRAVVFHDSRLDRLCPTKGDINDFSYEQLMKIKLNNGATIPAVRELFARFPEARFNIDVKSADAIPDLAVAISEYGIESKVLLTSFSESRRRQALKLVPGAATSPSAWLMVQILLAAKLRVGLKRLLQGVNVLQIPVSYGPIRLDSPRFIEAIHSFQVEIHYWTINEPGEAKRLKLLGADGVVSDNAAQVIAALSE